MHHGIKNNVGNDICQVFPSLNAFTGYYAVSKIANICKIFFYRVLKIQMHSMNMIIIKADQNVEEQRGMVMI